MAMYYYARKLQKSARKIKTTPTAQQTTPITANGSVPGCTSIISSSGVVCGPGAGVGCTSSLQPHQQASSLSPGSSDGGQQQQPQQNLQQLQLSLQNLGLAPAPAQSNQNTGPGAHPPPQHSSANPPLQQHLSSSTTSSSSSYPRPPIPSCLSAPVCPNPLLQKEWEKTGLVFQDSNLVSGSLDGLIRHLVPKPEYYPDRAFIFAFLLSSRLHIRPHELLGTVFRLAFAVPPEHSSSSSSSAAVPGPATTNYKPEDQIKIVAHMVKLLGAWAELFPYDFRDERIMAHVRAITQKCVSIDPPVRKDVSVLLTSLLNNLEKLEKYEAMLQKIAVETPLESEALSAPSILAICPCPILCAQSLTQIELFHLSHIGPQEFVQAFVKEIGTAGAAPQSSSSFVTATIPQSSTGGGSIVNGLNGAVNGSISGSTVSSSSDGLVRPGTSTASPATTAPTSSGSSNTPTSGAGKESRKTKNLEKYVKFHNYLCYIISSDIVKASKKKLRVKYIEYWIETARECFSIGNFNSLMAIITGLNMSPVLRMKKTWAKVNCDLLSLLSSLEQHVDPSSNFSSYRSLLKSVVWQSTNPSGENTRQKTVIPFFSLLIKDLYFLVTASASRLPNGNINFEKCWQLAKQVTELMSWQQVTCPFPKVPTIISALQTIPALSENALLLASFECEQPETSEEKERLKQLQEEANLLLQMTTLQNSALSQLPIVPPLPILFQPLPPGLLMHHQQPYVLVSTSADAAVPAMFLEQGQTQAHIESQLLHPHHHLSPGGVSPPNLESSSSQQDEDEDAVEEQTQAGHLVLPPPPS